MPAGHTGDGPWLTPTSCPAPPIANVRYANFAYNVHVGSYPFSCRRTPMTRYALALVAGWLLAGAALAEPPKIDRSIGKEPAYQSKTPKYGLLAFGPEAKD